MRGKRLFLPAAQDVDISGVRIPQICRVNRPVRIQNFRKAHSNPGTRLAFHFQRDPSHHVLTHVEDVGSVGRRNHALRLEPGDYSRGRIHLAGHSNGGRIRHQRRSPGRIVEPGLLPSCLFESVVIYFSAINIRSNDRRCGRPPGLVGYNRVMTTVGIIDF